jgi:hypothetical protein
VLKIEEIPEAPLKPPEEVAESRTLCFENAETVV